MTHTPSHSSYSKGCRCTDCRVAHRVYERNAARRRRRPDSNYEPMIRGDEARAHLLWLASKGVGLKRISNHTGLALATLQRIRKGTTTRVRHATWDAILSVNTGTLPPVKGKHPYSQPNYGGRNDT